MTELLTAEDIQRIMRRLAHEILEGHSGDTPPILLGIHSRGVPLAARIAAEMETIGSQTVAVGALDTTLFRDDLATRAPKSLAVTSIPEPIDGRSVVLVDDVLFTGRTVRAALDAVSALGRPARLRYVTLVDRGHRELPIRADHVGKNVPTAYSDVVHVKVKEIDGEDGVYVEVAS
jgi:pyrimidine operon attenuation protein / uracil phosphoribosyltransferase